MRINGVAILDTFAEGFAMWASRLIVTAVSPRWAAIAAREACGYGTSVIGCDAEAAPERTLPPEQTPDGRPGVAMLMLGFKPEQLGGALPNRTGQCLMTCPSTAVYDGMPEVAPPGSAQEPPETQTRLELGKRLRFFGDGRQKSKTLNGRRFWRVPVMDGEFVCEESVGCLKAVAGGNFLVMGRTQRQALQAADAAVEAIAELPEVITPFPGGVVRSGSKVGSIYKSMFASTNDAHCPTLRSDVATELPEEAQAVYEIVVNGLSVAAIERAIRAGVLAACDEPGVVAIGAGNYGGNLGKFHFHLRPILEGAEGARSLDGDSASGDVAADEAAEGGQR
jgi:formylmethanofuran--tetrahydromethanopterin N-formyltransferase